MSQLNKAASLINPVMRLLPTFPHKIISIFLATMTQIFHLQGKIPLKRAF